MSRKSRTAALTVSSSTSPTPATSSPGSWRCGLGLPRGRVFGTGTGLDTARLLSALARQTGVDHKSITCYMLGEHGNQQFAPWSCVSFRGMPLDEWAETDERFRFDREALKKESIGGGWVTFSGKYCTEYGIATTAARMAYTSSCTTKRPSCPPAWSCAASTANSGLVRGRSLRHRRKRRRGGRRAAPHRRGKADVPRSAATPSAVNMDASASRAFQVILIFQ